jgi:endonuclease YncB( thermonuclease family)
MTKLQPRCMRPLLVISVLAIATTVVAAPTLTGKVVSIADGDTLTLLVDKTQVKVRLEGHRHPRAGTAVWTESRTGAGEESLRQGRPG